MPQKGLVLYEPDIESDTPPTIDGPFTAWIPENNTTVEIFIEQQDYRQSCATCILDRCWIPEQAAVYEWVVEYGDGLVYEHACCCECHDGNEDDEDENVGNYTSLLTQRADGGDVVEAVELTKEDRQDGADLGKYIRKSN